MCVRRLAMLFVLTAAACGPVSPPVAGAPVAPPSTQPAAPRAAPAAATSAAATSAAREGNGAARARKQVTCTGVHDTALILVIDVSGSAHRELAEAAKSGAQKVAKELAASDWMEILTFDLQLTRAVQKKNGASASALTGEIGNMKIGGGGAISDALNMARRDLNEQPSCRQHVMLITDGTAAASDVRDLVGDMIADSQTITVVALGAGVDKARLMEIADVGGGRYLSVTDPVRLPDAMVRETQMTKASTLVE